jgi:hypothetical protein
VTELTVPLTAGQIAAAIRLHDRLPNWDISDRTLVALRERMPGFTPEETLVKTATINALYGTNLFAVVRMAEHVAQVLAETNLASAGPELVEQMAALPMTATQKHMHRHMSFAAKFAHFFIDPERFPIMDSYAVWMVEYHLGRKNCLRDAKQPYMAFVENLRRLREAAELNVKSRELDRYLWLAGQYRQWRKNPKSQINSELVAFFAHPSGESEEDLHMLAPFAYNGVDGGR